MRPAKVITALLLIVGVSSTVQGGPIHEAASEGDLTRLIELLATNPDLLSAPDDNQLTPLHHASAAGQTEIVAYLLENGAGLNDLNHLGQTPLHEACASGQTAVTRQLVAAGATIDLANGRGRTPLHLAACWGRDAEACAVLLDHGADISHVDNYGESILGGAAWWPNRDVVDLLLERGVALPAGTDERADLVNRACHRGHLNLLTRLLELGADPQRASDDGGSYLHPAAAGGSPEVLEILLARDLDPNQPNRYGVLPLHFAASNGHADIIDRLLAAGAAKDTRCALGKSAYNYAIAGEHSAAITSLEAAGVSRDEPQFPFLEGPYLGQVPPGDEPRLFAPGIVTGSDAEHSAVHFSPDGREVYWTSRFRGSILHMRLDDGHWTAPEPVAFSSEYGDGEPAFSHDGQRLYFLSFRPLLERDTGEYENLWYVQREDGAWSVPEPVSDAINDIPLHWQLSLTTDGVLYLQSTAGGGLGLNDLYRAELVAGEFTTPVNLGSTINTPTCDHTPFIARDESYLIFTSDGHPDNLGAFDLYISYRQPDGTWGAPRNLGLPINSPAPELCPVVSPDGEYLFFLSARNGNSDIYWVDAGFVEAWRPR